MSNTRTAAAAIPDYTTAGKRKNAKTDVKPFRLDGEIFQLMRPKQFDLAQMATVIDSGRSFDDPRNTQILLQFAGRMIRYILEVPPDPENPSVRHGRALLEYRLSDPEDSFDLVELMPILTDLMKGWFGRPTGSPPASTASRPATSRAPASQARTRSTRAKT